MEHPSQNSDERIGACAGSDRPERVVDILRQAYPEIDEFLPQKEAGKGRERDTVIRERIFVKGEQPSSAAVMKYIPFEQSILETAKVLKRYLER